ncbi:hypothetical protein [Paenibacillus sp. FSL W8-0194]|uniref:hypothetical protein n=1 Tax=Paenibacillus sp. FSL W8-0194 TaxID=2921711 RepID=UPI0030DB5D51
MKKWVSMMFLLALFVLPMSAYADSASSEDNLTLDEIKAHYEWIFNKYQVNEPFSAEDADFVMKHGKDVGAVFVNKKDDEPHILASGKKSFQGSKDNYAITGYVNYDMATIGKNTWDVYISAWDIAGIKRDITASFGIDCFGVIDVSTGAVGKIYSTTLSQSTQSKASYLDMSKSAGYTGWVISAYYYPKATFDNTTEVTGTFLN